MFYDCSALANLNITSWNLYLMTSEGVIGADWSSATIEKIEGGFLVNENNKYYYEE